MLKLVPFARSRREMANGNRDFELVCRFLKLNPPEAHAVSVAASPVGRPAPFIQNRSDLPVSLACGSGLRSANHAATLCRQGPSCESPSCHSSLSVAALTHFFTDGPLAFSCHSGRASELRAVKLGRESDHESDRRSGGSCGVRCFRRKHC